ncbi:MAG: hypothetical protein LLG44_11140 [Chloroflexi bacterium]|nr:hypothetical protein [Chloroflexota bacterium]
MSSDIRYTSVRLTYAQAALRAQRQFGKGGAAAYNLPGCAYCGADALATSLITLNGELKPPPDQPYGQGRIRVELTTHRCRKHAGVKSALDDHKRDVKAGTAGMIIGAVLYFLANMFGASNNIPFFSSSNVVLVLLVGIAFIILCTIAGEWLGRIFSHRPAGLPPAARVHSDVDGALVFEFLRPACAADFEAQLKADEK